uniref:Uncharacterized protein n=1 Tax=Arundo donax TaxID=35708 RepID=A0A0A8Z5T0_ARUDO
MDHLISAENGPDLCLCTLKSYSIHDKICIVRMTEKQNNIATAMMETCIESNEIFN